MSYNSIVAFVECSNRFFICNFSNTGNNIDEKANDKNYAVIRSNTKMRSNWLRVESLAIENLMPTLEAMATEQWLETTVIRFPFSSRCILHSDFADFIPSIMILIHSTLTQFVANSAFWNLLSSESSHSKL